MELLRDLPFLLVLLYVVCSASIRLFGTGGVEVERSEDDEEADVGNNHEALLFKAEPAAAHVILLDEVATSADLAVVEAAGDHDILLGFDFDADDVDETNDFSWKVCDVHDARYLFSRDRFSKCGWAEKSQYPKDIYID